MAERAQEVGNAGVRGVLLVAVAAACVVAVTQLPDLEAAILRAIPKAPASGVATPLTPPAPGFGAANGIATASGACVTYPALGVSSGKSVFVDAGHGGPDPGVIGAAGGAPLMEKAVTLGVAKRLTGLLQNDGYRVVMSRNGDSGVAAGLPSDGNLSVDDIHRDLLARIACANKSGADVLVSVHFNGVDDPNVGGSEAFYDAVRQFAANNHRLAIDLERSITGTIGSADLGVWPDDENVGPALSPAGAVYGHLVVLGPPSPGYVDTPSQMPGALVEPLFLSNSADARRAADPRTQQLIAVAIEDGVRAYFAGR